MTKIRICPICDRPVVDHSEDEIKSHWLDIGRANKRDLIIDEAISKGLVLGDLRKYLFEQALSEIGDNLSASQLVESTIDLTKTGTMFIYGTCGSGKTHMARCALMQSAGLGLTIAEVKATTLTGIAWRFDATERMDRYRDISVLLIDDIDKADWTSKGLALLWELFDHRYDRGLRTIITSNLSPENFKALFNKASEGNSSKVKSLIDRLQPVTKVEFVGKSKRRE